MHSDTTNDACKTEIISQKQNKTKDKKRMKCTTRQWMKNTRRVYMIHRIQTTV